jgi:hypothetical protein
MFTDLQNRRFFRLWVARMKTNAVAKATVRVDIEIRPFRNSDGAEVDRTRKFGSWSPLRAMRWPERLVVNCHCRMGAKFVARNIHKNDIKRDLSGVIARKRYVVLQ